MKGLNCNSLRITCLGMMVGMAFLAEISAADDAPPPNREAARLVRQLSDDDPAVRHNAAWHLREIGIPALPALQTVADSDDPEVRAAARGAIKAIGTPLPEAGNGPYNTKVFPTVDDYFSADFSDGKRVVRIEGECRKEGQMSPHHIKMTFTGLLNGKQVTQVFTGENEDDLKWNAPAAWKYYHSIYNHESDMRAVKVFHTALTEAVTAAMDERKLPDAERKQVLNRIQRFENVGARALAAMMYEPDEAPRKMAAEYRESDLLRKFLGEKKLPIVDRDMIPPPDERMGMFYSADPHFLPENARVGLMVKLVATGERAERLGIRPGDVIQKIDGVDIESGMQLRPACKANRGAMTVQVSRDGQPVILHEKLSGTPATKP